MTNNQINKRRYPHINENYDGNKMSKTTRPFWQCSYAKIGLDRSREWEYGNSVIYERSQTRGRH